MTFPASTCTSDRGRAVRGHAACRPKRPRSRCFPARATAGRSSAAIRFTLQEYHRDDMNERPYVLTAVNHSASEPIAGSGAESEASLFEQLRVHPAQHPVPAAAHDPQARHRGRPDRPGDRARGRGDLHRRARHG
ncbi:MAG: hypothetical protein MZV70_53675 [Desulfobacterales bacterium]|nr:hypothetical protein [Desulfobacterales bacterium]